MADLIIIRLHPREPMSGDAFAAVLKDLEITAKDLGFGDTANGVTLGTASGLADHHKPSTTNNQVTISSKSILQHYIDFTDPITLVKERVLEAAATAVIVVSVPAGHPEHPDPIGFDLRLEITNAGRKIQQRALDYNIAVSTVVTLSKNQKDYFAMAASAFVALPGSAAAIAPGTAFVELPEDGRAPNFDELVKAINLVLAKDLAGPNADLAHRAPLSIAQSQHIAAEIVWNRAAAPTPVPSRSLGELYTKPAIDTSMSQPQIDADRAQFEGEMLSYRSKLDTDTERLAGFVFAAGAAVACEAQSARAERAALRFPLLGVPTTGTEIVETSVTLRQTGGLNPQFIVPAAFYYALGAMMAPQIAAPLRYDMARLDTEARSLAAIATAIDEAAIASLAIPVTMALPAINAEQAARRLRALGVVGDADSEVIPAPPITVLVADWLAYAGASAQIDTSFWQPEVISQPAAYLELLLATVSGSHQPLIAAIKGAPHNVAAAATLVAISDQQWRNFFLGPSPPPGAPPRISLLPPFTEPGTPAERVDAFIRHLRKFFAVTTAMNIVPPAVIGAPPTLGTSVADVLAAFTAAYATHAGSAFEFGVAPNLSAFDLAISDVFPAELHAQGWLRQTLKTIDALFRITDLGPAFAELQFSLMEALYARGFADEQSIRNLSLADFQDALTGSVAYPHASALYTKAGATGPAASPAGGAFKPINSDGSLTNCIPPQHLSPFGPVEYLHELLKVSALSTCEQPLQDDDQGRIELLLAHRRGPLGNLHATRANLDTPLPMIDLVNESLEALAANIPASIGGAVYDTAEHELAGHTLRGREGKGHDPQTLFGALPEHSSPATPVEKPGAYDQLERAFTSPALPYAQPLDVCRSYLQKLRTTRFETMRRFRKQITEFVLDPAHEPTGFQRHLWRYPVRIDIAREYVRISPEEFDLLYTQDIVTSAAAGRLLLRELYGYAADTTDGVAWSEAVLAVPEFMARTGLSYCEFLALGRAQFVPMMRAGTQAEFPECEPCCLESLRIAFGASQDPLVALRKLAVFIRLWRRLREVPGDKLSFAQLRDIADVLHLFNGDAINADFIRQLVALLMLRDFMSLPLDDGTGSAATGADRPHLLALWVGPGAAKWDWALETLLGKIDAYAESRMASLRRSPELIKVIVENLDPLSRLAGFDPSVSTDTWHAQPTHTLRFVEILAKIYASDFTVGEILFLFTALEHLDGDDPFPLPDANEAVDAPFNLPEDDGHALWTLRKSLLAVEPGESLEQWSWRRIDASLREEFGFTSASGQPDALIALAEHFFPSEMHGWHAPTAAKRQYRVSLAGAATSPLMWNMPRIQPFHYDPGTQELWTELPIKDEAVIEALQEMRPLSSLEQAAVHGLYFAPRAALAKFSFLFANFGEAIERLIQEADENKRWQYFRQEFARFHRRCELIAEHLAGHVSCATGGRQLDAQVAWRVLKQLHADENFGKTPWEADSGAPPDVAWGPQPNGGAFAGLLGLTGTGLLAEFSTDDASPVWREMTGPLCAFGDINNRWNAPVPTITPALGLILTPAQRRFVTARNGFALRDADGKPLGGAQRFRVRWSGTLLVEQPGQYRFFAGAPTPQGQQPDFDAAQSQSWRLTLRRGQKSWILLNNNWVGEDAPDDHSGALLLRRGAYQIVAELEQREPTFLREEDLCAQTCGFEIKYCGPDSGDCPATLPVSRLYRNAKDELLGARLDRDGSSGEFLAEHYTSTLRDIRRTYQRAFKAVLFACRFQLSAKPMPGDRQSELGYLLDHGQAFFGTSHPRTGAAAFGTHHAYFDFNLLPVTDPYRPPLSAHDSRQQPSAMRQRALFDWWERIWDYCLMRKQTRAARERPAWLLFHEASERQPDDPPQLVRHVGVDIRHAPLVLNYFDSPAPYVVSTPDLEDERWAVRVWHGDQWVRGLLRHFFAEWIGAARPDLWAADDPKLAIGSPPHSGNQNLTRFVQDGCFENAAPRRYQDVARLNDGLRERARAALLAYLCGMDRVPLPWNGAHAKVPRDLSELLLQDVEVGLCQRASRIEEATSAIHAYVQRARLGLEPELAVTEEFSRLWERVFATFNQWKTCKLREIYRENWIYWDELEKDRKTDAFHFFESELRRATLAIPVPGGLEYWPGARPPAHPGLCTLQSSEPSAIELFNPGPVPEGLGLLGTPDRDGRPSWMAPVRRFGGGTRGGTSDGIPNDGNPNGNPNPGIDPATGLPVGAGNNAGTNSPLVPGAPGGRFGFGENSDHLPLWFQTAVRLGTRFLRIAAAAIPPASTQFVARRSGEHGGCCAECGCEHPPTMDEYYFWLEDAREFDEDFQHADDGVQPPDSTSGWHKPNNLANLLHWDSAAAVSLFWCRVHNGEFQQPRRSSDVLAIDASFLSTGKIPQLDFKGRLVDSLRFEISGALVPAGHNDPSPPGFRYDIENDSAVTLPLVEAALPAASAGLPGGLRAYPYFAYFPPGAPVEPASMFSVAHAVARTLRSHCRFEAALKWYEIAFGPLIRDNTWSICPTRDPAIPDPAIPDGGGDGGPDNPNGILVLPGRIAIAEVTAGDTTCCPTVAETDRIARERAVTLAYLETLLMWGDALMCRNSPEAFQQATVVYGTAERILGVHPKTVMAHDETAPMTVATFAAWPAPLNPGLISLYERTGDRLETLHHCSNARRLKNGRPNLDMPYFGDDPVRDGWIAAMNCCGDDDGCSSCCNAYRFSYLLQKSLELAGEVRAFGAELQAAYEKGDAEALASLRATHERQLLELALEIRKDGWRESDWQVQALRKTKESAQTRKRYFDGLIRVGLIADENVHVAQIDVSNQDRTAANGWDARSAVANFIPDFTFGAAGIAGSPVAINQIPIGSKIANALSTRGRIAHTDAEIVGTNASLSMTFGGWARRLAEWQHQSEVIGIESEQIERQILAAERRRDMALRELNDQQRQIEHSTEVQNFLRDKLTSHSMFLFQQQEAAANLFQIHQVASQLAARTQRAFNYERGFTSRTFLPEHGWDNLHHGLLAGERLQLALRQMEKAYLDSNCREYELTKHISLRQDFPLAFLQLQQSGCCEIELPEWLFDRDYPSHYMRRVKNVMLTIPCVVGPYTGVHCRLTLLSSATRIDPRLSAVPADCCDGEEHDGYTPLRDDPRIVKTYGATEAIATSSGQNDSGMFELNFRDERYLPFEFRGATSCWRFELPRDNNRFDIETMSDVVMHLNYTAREGGEQLRAAAGRLAHRKLTGDGLRLFDVQREFPEAWHRVHAHHGDQHAHGDLLLPLRREHFAFDPRHRDLELNRLELFLELHPDSTRADHVVRFLARDQIQSEKDGCECDGYDIHCVRSVETSDLYHGVLRLDANPLEVGKHGEVLGALRFGRGFPKVRRAFLLCGYGPSTNRRRGGLVAPAHAH